MTTPLARALADDAEELAERQAELDRELPPGADYDAATRSTVFAPTGSDHSSTGVAGNQRHQPLTDPDRRHFSEKLYFFPESFNALRRELETHYPTFFNSINPEMGVSPAWAMVFDAPKFIGMCNAATDLSVQMDSGSVDAICSRFLNAFRAMRGVGQIN